VKRRTEGGYEFNLTLIAALLLLVKPRKPRCQAMPEEKLEPPTRGL